MINVRMFLCRSVVWTKLLPMLTILSALLQPFAAHALPAFARQTGQSCVACHAGGQFPELTSFGRLFKLNAYALGTNTLPLSVMGLASLAKTSTPTTDAAFAKDANALFQTGSVFLAGKITDKSGIFVQATYNNYDSQNEQNGDWQGKWVSDNFDLRYADDFSIGGKQAIAGAFLNNNPSLADPWNTAPAWMQYVPTAFGVTGPDASPIISQLGQQTAGFGGYLFWDQTLYAELAAYRTANGFWSFLSQGNSNPDQLKLKGFNPYLRLALTKAWGPHNAMIGGVLALDADIYPDNLAAVGPTIRYRDRGVDAQYQYLQDAHAFTAQMSYIRETISNGDVTGVSANPSNTLNQLKLKASYIYRNKYGASLSHFNTNGSADATAYPDPAANPGTAGWIPEIFWMPVQEIRIGAQYFTYNRFHGASTNYDGAGRNAKDNNTLFIYVFGAY